MSTESRKPFNERFAELLSIAVMRNGYLGPTSYYGGHNYNTEAYKLFRLGKVQPFDVKPAPSIDGAKCPKCRAKLALKNVHETQTYCFAGTFAESDNVETLVEGTLVCPKYEQHTRELPSGMTTVRVDSTISSLLNLIGDIADEMGY